MVLDDATARAGLAEWGFAEGDLRSSITIVSFRFVDKDRVSDGVGELQGRA